jgi:hypothetical protein
MTFTGASVVSIVRTCLLHCAPCDGSQRINAWRVDVQRVRYSILQDLIYAVSMLYSCVCTQKLVRCNALGPTTSVFR